MGWLSVLKMIPWVAVISNAPKVADSAKKLWRNVAKKSASTPHPVTQELPSNPTLASLQTQLIALETTVLDLHNQMLASSELIKALADQNAQLVKCVESNRVRLLWLATTTLLLLIVVVTMAVRA